MKRLKDKKLFLLDLDGTIYLDDILFNGAKEFLEFIKEIGGKYIFLTNNSSLSVKAYIEKLCKMGIESSKDDYLTSVDAMIIMLKDKFKDEKIYALGTGSFKEQLSDAGFNIVDTVQDDIKCLVMGFDTELTFKKLEDACILLQRDIGYYATNPDWVCPTGFGGVPDCGAVSDMLYRATKRNPIFIGKPRPDMALLAVKNSGFGLWETLMIGDRLYTDIACGNNLGIDTVLVLSGETKIDDLSKCQVKPTFTYKNIKELTKNIRFSIEKYRDHYDD